MCFTGLGCSLRQRCFQIRLISGLKQITERSVSHEGCTAYSNSVLQVLNTLKAQSRHLFILPVPTVGHEQLSAGLNHFSLISANSCEEHQFFCNIDNYLHEYFLLQSHWWLFWGAGHRYTYQWNEKVHLVSRGNAGSVVWFVKAYPSEVPKWWLVLEIKNPKSCCLNYVRVKLWKLFLTHCSLFS